MTKTLLLDHDSVPVTGALLNLICALHAARSLFISESQLAEDFDFPAPQSYLARCRELFLGKYAAAAETLGLKLNEQTFAALMRVDVPVEAHRTQFDKLPRRFVFDPWHQMGIGAILRVDSPT